MEFFRKRDFLFILVLSAGFLGFFMPSGEIFWRVQGIPRLELFQLIQRLRLSAEKLILFGLKERGETVRLKE